jgi:alpha-1,3-glucosyltransferase
MMLHARREVLGRRVDRPATCRESLGCISVCSSISSLFYILPFTMPSLPPADPQNLLESPRFIVMALLFLTCFKILLMPSYRSTDFDVHRNWLATTRHLPLSDWYFDDFNNQTVHTLDYPPSFAYFEYELSSVGGWFVSANLLDERCLQQLADDDNEVSFRCVAFQRSTVILSDLVLFWGAWMAATSSYDRQRNNNNKAVATIFLLIVLYPGLLWLDHVHFQYNGMLLGLLLASLGYMNLGMRQDSTRHVLLSATLYAFLLTLKHLYLPLAPLYFVFLLRHYCMISNRQSFSLSRFVKLAAVTGATLVLPFVPFLSSTQLPQLVSRLFPFQRGLVHDYWAANVWAIYMLAGKILRFTSNMVLIAYLDLPEVSATSAAACLLVSLLPALHFATKPQSRLRFTQMVVYTSFCAFMLSYHVHEKAILTTLLPLATLIHEDVSYKRLFVRASALGLFGLWPLLFRPIELLMKVSSYVAYMSFCDVVLQQYEEQPLLTAIDKTGIFVVSGAALFLEVLHPLFVYPAMEFLPLLLTSILCAIGLILCWVQSYRLMVMIQPVAVESRKKKLKPN